MSQISSSSPKSSKNISVAVKINNKILKSSSPEIVLNIVEENKDRLNNVNITTAIHRVAKICHRKPQKITKIQPRLGDVVNLIFERCDSFSGRQLANSTWGMAIMQVKHPELYEKISFESRKRLNDFEPQHLAILVWSFATLNINDKTLFDKVSLKAILEIGKFSPQNLSNLAWSYAKVNHCEPLLFKNISAQAIKTISEFAPQNISNLIWSYGALKICETELVEKVVDESMKRLEEFNTQNLSNLAWSVAVLLPAYKFNPILFGEIAEVSLVKMDYFNARYLSNLVWALAVVSVYPDKLLKQAIEYMNAADTAELEDLGPAAKTQWYQIDLVLKLEHPAFSKEVSLNREIRKHFAKDFLKSEISNCDSSSELDNILSFLKLPSTPNFILDEGFVVSNMLPPESQRCAVVLLGAGSFSRASAQPLGGTLLRERLLRANGWRVATVNAAELAALPSFDQKVRLVASRLAGAGVFVPAPPPFVALSNVKGERAGFAPLAAAEARPDPYRFLMLEGLMYRTCVRRGDRYQLFDVELTRPLGGRFGEGFLFELVEICLRGCSASYFLRAEDREAVFVHPVMAQ